MLFIVFERCANACFVGELFDGTVGVQTEAADAHKELACFDIVADAGRVADEVATVGADDLGLRFWGCCRGTDMSHSAVVLEWQVVVLFVWHLWSSCLWLGIEASGDRGLRELCRLEGRLLRLISRLLLLDRRLVVVGLLVWKQ